MWYADDPDNTIASPSYNPGACCNSDCFAYDDDRGKCWGDVSVIDEVYSDTDYEWIHACEGHKEMWNNSIGKYIPEPIEYDYKEIQS